MLTLCWSGHKDREARVLDTAEEGVQLKITDELGTWWHNIG